MKTWIQLHETQKHKAKCIKILTINIKIKMQKNTFCKHKKQNVKPIVNTRSKMQHQLFVVEHKIHVHQIPKTATLDSKMQHCTMLQRHDHTFYTQ
jgi:hypothetical protein